MEFLFRLTLSITLVAAVAVGVGFAQPEWLADLGLDFWNLPQAERELARSQELNEKLAEKQHEQNERAARIEELVARLIAQKISLTMAADVVLSMGHECELEVGWQYLQLKGKTPHERTCRLLIYWAEKQLERDSLPTAEVVARLNAEFERDLASVK